MDETTQKNKLKSWVEERDSILSEISILRDEKEKLLKSNREISESYTRTCDEINQSKGRLLELDIKEKEVNDILSTELADTLIKKNELESKIPILEKQVSILESEKKSLIDSIETLQSINSGFFTKNIELEKQIGGIIELNEKNVNVVTSMMESLKVSTKELIDINKKNVEETNIVIDKLPRMVVELQKRGLIKKI